MLYLLIYLIGWVLFSICMICASGSNEINDICDLLLIVLTGFGWPILLPLFILVIFLILLDTLRRKIIC